MVVGCACRRDQFTLNMNSIPQGAGSGTIWSSDGFIVTNYHVRDALPRVCPAARDPVES
jgi:S1-C subfamily serine protease